VVAVALEYCIDCLVEQSQEWGDGDGQILALGIQIGKTLCRCHRASLRQGGTWLLDDSWTSIARWFLDFRYRFQISLYWHSLFPPYTSLTDKHTCISVSSFSCTLRRPYPFPLEGVMVTSWFSTCLNTSCCVSIIVDKKCTQFIYTMTLELAMLIPVSNLTDISTYSNKHTTSTCIKLYKCI
jgi:hypothetical protein